jgi:RNase adapter protein RapZ
VSGALQDVVVITGFSGAGKSTAMNVFEDAGWFCVDNLPPEMLGQLVGVFMHDGSKVEHAAVVCDVRAGELLQGLTAALDRLEAGGVDTRLLFLDAREDKLLDRFKETRRRHPLAPDSSISTGIAAERELLAPLRARADVLIDTSELKTAHLRRRIADELLPRRQAGPLVLTLQSFGFKHGPPRDADLVLDVRFLPNPHYVPELRPLTGLDQRVVDHVAQDGTLQAFYDRLEPLLDFLVPQYEAEGKAHLLLAVGCTGGRHRSVTVVEHLARRFAGHEDLVVEVEHRDADRRR